MDQIYSDFSITIHELEDISNIDDIQTKLIICGMSGENKTFTKALFVGMAEADGMIHPKEMEIINQFFIWYWLWDRSESRYLPSDPLKKSQVLYINIKISLI